MREAFDDRNKERGVALLVALFAVLLFSVVGMYMLASAGTEGKIHSNYLDKQVAVFAAMSGLQEARDRIQPAILTIVPPSTLPSLTNGNVIYVINPKSGETIAPWDTSSSNLYMDSELCQEGILGLSGTPGAPCTTVPSGSTWYTVYNDSLSAAGIWKSSNPLDLKWVRITLKTNNMSRYPANGSSSTATQVCWDGSRQILLPTGYDPNCIRYGSVKSISVTDGGSGYSSTPTVTIDPPSEANSVQATAHANMVAVASQQVQSVTVVTGGTNYATAPTVSFSGGGGSGATAVATIAPLGAPISSITLNSGGTACYSTAPAVSFVGGGGSGATATATLASTNSCIAGWTVSGSCNSKKGNTVSGISLGSPGSNFSGTLTFNSSGGISSMSIQNPGTGYTTAPTTWSLNGCNSVTFTATLGKVVTGVSLTSGGSGYTSTPTVSFTTGTGTTATQPTATATSGAAAGNAGQVLSVTVTNGGSNYTSAPTVVLTPATGDSGTGATATATLGTLYYKVASVTMDEMGRGYTTIPNVSFSGGGGSGAAATANLGGGANWGKVYMLTALAQTKSGARSMLQMEATTAVTGFAAPSGLVLDGPNPNIGSMPNSNNFYVDGHDQNSCGDATASPNRPAIGGYEDYNADPPTHSVDTIVASLPRPDHYIGDGSTPSVSSVTGDLGETLSTPTGLKAYIDSIRAQKQNPTNTDVLLGSAVAPTINYIDGDLTLNGNSTGYGILVVTGTLTMSGNFSWYGTVLVVGDGIIDFSGGGNGSIHGTLLIAKIWDNHTNQNLLTSLGSPTMSWNGGGNNGFYYDHCWAEDLMSKIYFDAPVSTKPLKVLSLRTLLY